MVKVQMLTGMRSGEVCLLRPVDVDQTADVWEYRPTTHKTTHHGKDRVVAIGPLAQAILLPLLSGIGPGELVFSPARAEVERRARRSVERRTPRWHSHMQRNHRKRKVQPKRRAGERYNSTSYARCIARACKQAFPLPPSLRRGRVEDGLGRGVTESIDQWRQRIGEDGWDQVAKWWKDHHWHPHQLRHLRATEVRERFGLDAAQVVLGHSQANVTQIYAKVSMAKAVEVAKLAG
jgi:integrase